MIRDLACMTVSQREAYARWLIAQAKGKRGSIAERLRQAGNEILQQTEFA